MRTLQQLQSLANRAALITGGAGHLGRAFAETLAEMGCNLVLVDSNPDTARVAEEITSHFGVRCLAEILDLRDLDAVRSLPTSVAERLGRLDILINNAGFTGDTSLTGWCVPFAEQSAEAWRAASDVNLLAPFLLIQASTPHLKTFGKGAIVNIASIYGVSAPDMRIYDGTSMGNPAAYSTSKAGLIQLTKYCATLLSPDIRVNCITPGGVFRNQPESFVQKYCAKTPLGRMAKEEDFKGAIAYLCSDMSAYVTGHNLVVDGGWTIW